MKLELNIPDLDNLKKSYDEDGYNHIPELFSPADMDLSLIHISEPTRPY